MLRRHFQQRRQPATLKVDFSHQRRGRNAIERKFCRLEACRCLAIRYYKLAASLFDNIHLVAAIM